MGRPSRRSAPVPSLPCSEEAKSTTWLHPVTGEAVVTGHRRQSTGRAGRGCGSGPPGGVGGAPGSARLSPGAPFFSAFSSALGDGALFLRPGPHPCPDAPRGWATPLDTGSPPSQPSAPFRKSSPAPHSLPASQHPRGETVPHPRPAPQRTAFCQTASSSSTSYFSYVGLWVGD